MLLYGTHMIHQAQFSTTVMDLPVIHVVSKSHNFNNSVSEASVAMDYISVRFDHLTSAV